MKSFVENRYQAMLEDQAHYSEAIGDIAKDPGSGLNPVTRRLFAMQAWRTRPTKVTRGVAKALDARDARRNASSEARTPLVDETAPESRVISHLGRLGAHSMADSAEPTIDPTVTSQPELADGVTSTQVAAEPQQLPDQSPEDNTGR